MNKNSHKTISKSQKNTPSSWMDSIYSSTAHVFAKPSSFKDVFSEVGMSSDWGIRITSEDERVCYKYESCIILFYECALSIMGICLPFIAFEIEVSNHLAMAQSQVHPP